MTSLDINIVLPFLTTKPGGGTKIMYEYANRLSERGHRVIVIHSIQRPYRKIKSPVWWKQIQYRMRGLSRPRWFHLHEDVQSLVVPSITDDYVPDADITLCTWWEMTYMISRLSSSKGQKFNLVQDYETWKGHEELVHASYQLPVHHLVIADYLEKIVEKYNGERPTHIPNAVDTNRFNVRIVPEERNPHSIIMLYSEEPRKGTEYGLKALTEVKKTFPDLHVELFGVYDHPKIESWMNYTQKSHDLAQLMNSCSIFFTPSLGEGWALPPAEAMACGCAVVCTKIGGHADYAIDGKTALLAEPKNVPDMVKKLTELLKNHEKRIQLAQQGFENIVTQFSWEVSVNRMEDAFLHALAYR
jgi:glycosyltransferase involved in cell wall biosynthesis